MPAPSIKSRIPCLLILLLFVISCKDSDNEHIEPVKDPESCSFKKMVIPSWETTELVYNSKGLPVQIIQDDLSASQRDQISMIEYDDRDNVIKISQDYGYLEYEYDVNNKVLSGKIFYRTDLANSFTRTETFRYTYNKDGLMDSVIYQDRKQYRRFEYDSRGYVVKAFDKEYLASEKLIREYLKFDDKQIAYTEYFSHYTLPTVRLITLISLQLPRPTPHNIETEKILLAGGTMDTRTYTYTYNELGYPVTMTKSATMELSLPEKAGVTFVYDCK